MKPTGGKKQPNKPNIQCYKRLLFVSQPPHVWQMEPRYTSRQSQQPRQYQIRMPPKGEAELGLMGGMCQRRCTGEGWRVEYWCKAIMTNKMQIVATNNQTPLTADSRRCLIDSDSESKVFGAGSFELKSCRTELPWLTQIRDVTTTTPEPGSQTIKCNESKHKVGEGDVNTALMLKFLLVKFAFISSDVWSSFGIGVWANEDEMIQGHILFTHFSCSYLGG